MNIWAKWSHLASMEKEDFYFSLYNRLIEYSPVIINNWRMVPQVLMKTDHLLFLWIFSLKSSIRFCYKRGRRRESGLSVHIIAGISNEVSQYLSDMVQ